ncbi:hypothetical protein GGI25_003117 [Coemansia spiralis]|uniref:Uncharacterized protein n=2 Tax=Coemansia TaxID=4863 RepID=A0A9W8G799_9FUNG|nr:hypothetical protein GGI25_003117 [Coemansia spiralis]
MMRYSSPVTQMSLIGISLLLTFIVRRLLINYLLQSTPLNENPTFDLYWPTSAIACASGFVAIFVINLIGVRAIFLFQSIFSVVYASSIVVGYQYNNFIFHSIAYIIISLGYNLARVATIVVVLTYSSERWRTRALGTYLFLEYFSMTMGDLIAHRNRNDSNAKHLHVAIATLSIACLAPFFAAAIAPINKVVRSNGVYLIARESNFGNEVKQTLAMFKNKYMLLLLPYMFSYPFLYSVANAVLEDTLTVILYDLGKLSIIAMGQLLDVPWSTRRTRGLVGYATLLFFFVLSSSLTVTTRMLDNGWGQVDPSWSKARINEFLTMNALKIHRGISMASYFFGGVASSFIELFGFWVIGTLTNDVRACGRFVGTYHSVMSIGGMVGIQIISNVPLKYVPINMPAFAGLAITIISLILLYFIIRRITDTNDWTLGKIANTENSTDGNTKSDQSSETYMVITDVKYRHIEDQAGD